MPYRIPEPEYSTDEERKPCGCVLVHRLTWYSDTDIRESQFVGYAPCANDCFAGLLSPRFIDYRPTGSDAQSDKQSTWGHFQRMGFFMVDEKVAAQELHWLELER